ncbi:hypothetical protein V6R21_19160 [Limibacter armeniacum]|uniref:hypothetical protein n=1 Tax=Limibacter armeniacum TaxID=466084 RepID=UPI002FE505A1
MNSLLKILLLLFLIGFLYMINASNVGDTVAGKEASVGEVTVKLSETTEQPAE